MKKLALLLLALSLNAHAVLSPTRVVDADKTNGVFSFRNLVANDGFEKGSRQFTASGGTYTITTTAANVGDGQRAASWDSSAASQTLTSTAVAIPAGDYGANYEVSANLECATGTCTHLLQAFDGTNVVASAAITSSTSYVRTTVNFVAPSSGNLSARLISVASNEPIIYVDDIYLGRARNIGSVAQATYFGGAFHPGGSNCTYSENTSSGESNFVSMGSAGSCATSWTNYGSASVSAATTSALTLTSAPAGRYLVLLRAPLDSTGTNHVCNWRFNDGTNSFGAGSSFNSGQLFVTGISGEIEYNDSGTRTINLQAADNTSGSCSISANGTGRQVEWAVYRFPLSSEMVVRPELLANSWSGYHSSISGGCAVTSSTFSDFSSCTGITINEIVNNNFGTVTTAASSLPGITFTPKVTGVFEVCAYPYSGIDTSQNYAFRLVDGSGTIINRGVGNTFALAASKRYTPAVCGLYRVSDLTSKTIKLQGATSGGSLDFAAAPTDGGAFIQWVIKNVTQNTAPMVINTDNFGSTKHSLTANCLWETTSGSYGAFSADADCSVPSGSNLIGKGQAPATKIPATLISSIPDGAYMVYATGYLGVNAGTSCTFRLFDGTNQIAEVRGDNTGGDTSAMTLIGMVNYSTSQSNLQLQVQAKRASGSSTCFIDNRLADFQIGIVPINR